MSPRATLVKLLPFLAAAPCCNAILDMHAVQHIESESHAGTATETETGGRDGTASTGGQPSSNTGGDAGAPAEAGRSGESASEGVSGASAGAGGDSPVALDCQDGAGPSARDAFDFGSLDDDAVVACDDAYVGKGGDNRRTEDFFEFSISENSVFTYTLMPAGDYVGAKLYPYDTQLDLLNHQDVIEGSEQVSHVLNLEKGP